MKEVRFRLDQTQSEGRLVAASHDLEVGVLRRRWRGRRSISDGKAGDGEGTQTEIEVLGGGWADSSAQTTLKTP